MKTPYYKLAERIADSIYFPYWYCCERLPLEFSKEFTKIFKPKRKEMFYYSHFEHTWMAGYNTTVEEDNNLRILALLFMDQFVKSESKSRHKH